MADDGAQYKNMSVKTIRGLEARSRAKWEKDGWEFVSQDQVSRLRSELTFRRLKKKQPWYLWPAIAGGVLLVVGLFVIAGVLQGSKDSGSTNKAAPVAASTPTATPTSIPTAIPQPSPTVTAPPPSRRDHGGTVPRYAMGGQVHVRWKSPMDHGPHHYPSS